MTQFFEWVGKLFSSWKFWIVVPPWDVGVRVRLGRNATRLDPGFHFRVPLVDAITLVNTRLRVISTPAVTLDAAGARSVVHVIAATVGFRIADPVKAMGRFENPAVAVIGYTQAGIVQRLAPPENLAALCLHFAGSGVEPQFVQYVDDVKVRAFRLLQGDWKVSDSSLSGGPEGRY